MGTTLALIGLIGGAVSLVLIEMLFTGDKSALYRAALFLVGATSLIAFIVSLFFSRAGVDALGTILSALGLIATVVFYIYGSAEKGPVSEVPEQSLNDDNE